MSKFLETHVFPALFLGFVLLFMGFLALYWPFRSAMDRLEWQEITYLVQAGDSLWSISNEYCPDAVDRREWIAEVKLLNGLDDSIIHPGQRITILTVREG